MDKKLQELKEITDLNAVPGNESQVKNYMKKKFEKMNCNISYDNIGSIFATKIGNENGPRIIATGHLDEVGFMVSKITNEGFIKFVTLGGWVPTVMLAQQVTITTSTGTVHGVIGSKPPHIMSDEERKATPKIEGMFIDCGACSKQEVIDMGIKLGDMITPYTEFKVMGRDQKHLLAKAWDNRIGCVIAMDIMENLQNVNHPNIFVAGGTVQEEVGCRGAQTVGYMAHAQIGFSFDVSLSVDVPGDGGRVGECEGMQMGKGPQIHLMDSGTIGHKALREFVCGVAEELSIPYQLTIIKGGTDASKFHIAHEGAPCLSIGVPSRYIHSHTSMIHRDDYENCVKLMTEVIKRLDYKKVAEIIAA